MCHSTATNNKDIIDIITKVEKSVDLIQHYLAADNVYADGEFDDNNVVECTNLVCILLFVVCNKSL